MCVQSGAVQSPVALLSPHAQKTHSNCNRAIVIGATCDKEIALPQVASHVVPCSCQYQTPKAARAISRGTRCRQAPRNECTCTQSPPSPVPVPAPSYCVVSCRRSGGLVNAYATTPPSMPERPRAPTPPPGNPYTNSPHCVTPVPMLSSCLSQQRSRASSLRVSSCKLPCQLPLPQHTPVGVHTRWRQLLQGLYFRFCGGGGALYVLAVTRFSSCFTWLVCKQCRNSVRVRILPLLRSAVPKTCSSCMSSSARP